jgi:hypothetical protein
MPDVNEVEMEMAQLGIDGNCGFALWGIDLQNGEAEFVEITGDTLDDKTKACTLALQALRKRLNKPGLGYYFRESHPFGK